MSIVLTRKELYDRVWTEPMQKLSKDFGLSDVGLAKTCRRYAIPVPPRGYWAKKQAGHAVRQTPLPAHAPAGCGDTIEIGPQDHPAVVEQSPAPIEHAAVAAESEPGNRIEAPRDDLRVTHPLLRSTREYWKATRSPILNWPRDLPKHIQISVSEALRARTVRVLQTLFSALEKRGYSISPGEHGAIQVKVLDETCGLTVRERQRQVRGERRRLADPDLYKGKSPHDLVYTGELELRVEGRFGRRSSITDASNMRVEDRLNDVVGHLVRAALAEKDYRAEQELARLASIERERERAATLQLKRRELARVRRLDELADAAGRHRHLTAFRDALRTEVSTVDPESELGQWLDWIDSYLEDIDVLRAFRNRAPALMLYHCVSNWQADSILKAGFTDAATSHAQSEERPASVAFTDVPMRGAYGGTTCIVIEVSEDAVLPYESLERDAGYRQFAVPAEVANRYERRAVVSG